MAVPDARSARGSAPLPRTPLGLWKNDGWLAFVGAALIYLGHSLYGAMLPQTALTLVLVWATLVGGCLLRPRIREDLLRLDHLIVPGTLFGLVTLVAAWSLTPLVPGGPHPTWEYLGIRPGAATVDKSATTLEILKLLGLGCVFVAGLCAGGSDKRARLTINALVGAGAVYAVWALLTFVASRGSSASRLEATFQSANTAGTVFATLLVLAIGPFISKLRSDGPKRVIDAAVVGVASMLFLASVFLTASRGALLAALAGLTVFAMLQIFASRAKFSRVLLGAVGVLFTVLGLMATGGDYMLSRILGSVEGVTSRSTIAEAHWQAFLTSPLMGFGMGTFDVVHRTLLDNANFHAMWTVRAAHNVYLSWLEQAGLLGALPMFGCIAALVFFTFRRASRRTRSVNLIFALIAADAVFIVHGITDFALEMFSVSAMWAFLLGLQFSLAQGSSTR